MFFLRLTEKLAQKLLRSVPYICALLIFLFSQGNLFANEWDEPIVLLEDPLVPAIELRDGQISEVFVETNSEVAHRIDDLEIIKPSATVANSHSFKSQSLGLVSELVCHPIVHLDQEVGMGKSAAVSYWECSTNTKEAEVLSVKSIANLGLVGFLGICLSRSELPSKNSLTPCENYHQKSMTLKFANVWKSSWQQVKTTYLWPTSTNSFRTQRTSIQRQSLSHTHSMSDILSIWSNEMDVYPRTLPAMKLQTQRPLETKQGKNLTKQILTLVDQNPNKQNHHLQNQTFL